MANKAERSLMMSSTRFVNVVKEGYDANLRYCFILGAGASFTSGIPLAKHLMEEWRTYLLGYSAKVRQEIAAAVSFDYDQKVAPLFEDDYVPKSDDYFTLYDLRFANMHVQSYAYLQGLMDKAKPSFGYYALALLLEDTHNKLVITTNFDSLAEETLSLTHAMRPLVVGHESLAPFLGSTENRNRATIVKVHRDLLMHPKNSEGEVRGMDASLTTSLRKALTNYTPIVVGYAGADQSLMALLESMSFDSMYWCVMEKDENEVDERVRNLLRNNAGDGHLVHIRGFDEIMYMLLDRFMRETDYKNPDARIREYMDGRITEYKEQRETIKDSLAKIRPSDSLRTATSGSRNPTGTGPTSPSGADSPIFEDDDTVPLHTLEKLYEVDRQTDDNTKDTNAEKANLSYLQGVQAYNEGRYEEALAKFDEAVRLEPGSARYRDSRGVTLHELGRHEEAQEEERVARILDSGDASSKD